MATEPTTFKNVDDLQDKIDELKYDLANNTSEGSEQAKILNQNIEKLTQLKSDADSNSEAVELTADLYVDEAEGSAVQPAGENDGEIQQAPENDEPGWLDSLEETFDMDRVIIIILGVLGLGAVLVALYFSAKWMLNKKKSGLNEIGDYQSTKTASAVNAPTPGNPVTVDDVDEDDKTGERRMMINVEYHESSSTFLHRVKRGAAPTPSSNPAGVPTPTSPAGVPTPTSPAAVPSAASSSGAAAAGKTTISVQTESDEETSGGKNILMLLVLLLILILAAIFFSKDDKEDNDSRRKRSDYHSL